MYSIAATSVEVVRAMLFFKFFEIAQYHTVNKKDVGVSSLVRAMSYTVGAAAAHKTMPDLLTAVFLYKLLELMQLTASFGRRSLPSILAENLISTVDMIAPRDICLLPAPIDRPQLQQPQQSEPQPQQSDSGEVPIRDSSVKFHPDDFCPISDHELPSITEEGSECDGEETFRNEIQDEVCCFLPSPEKKKKVSFSRTADVYIFDMTIGDNPSVSSGPPVQLSWSASLLWKTIPLEMIHAVQPSEKVFPRFVKRISPERRRSILLFNGCSSAEISKATKLAKKAFKSRCSTIQTTHKQQTRQERIHSVKDLFFCGRIEDIYYHYPYERHVPFLSTSQELEPAGAVCPVCATICLKDTFKSNLTMYQCRGRCYSVASSRQGVIKDRSSSTHLNSHSVVSD